MSIRSEIFRVLAEGPACKVDFMAKSEAVRVACEKAQAAAERRGFANPTSTPIERVLWEARNVGHVERVGRVVINGRSYMQWQFTVQGRSLCIPCEC